MCSYLPKLYSTKEKVIAGCMVATVVSVIVYTIHKLKTRKVA